MHNPFRHAARPPDVMTALFALSRVDRSVLARRRYAGAADIPIVRLNPLGILDVKRQGEEALRKGGASYAIVRPCGLNDNWPSGRPILSQGDVAVGRINRGDVAELLTRLVCDSCPVRTRRAHSQLARSQARAHSLPPSLPPSLSPSLHTPPSYLPPSLARSLSRSPALCLSRSLSLSLALSRSLSPSLSLSLSRARSLSLAHSRFLSRSFSVASWRGC